MTNPLVRLTHSSRHTGSADLRNESRKKMTHEAHGGPAQTETSRAMGWSRYLARAALASAPAGLVDAVLEDGEMERRWSGDGAEMERDSPAQLGVFRVSSEERRPSEEPRSRQRKRGPLSVTTLVLLVLFESLLRCFLLEANSLKLGILQLPWQSKVQPQSNFVAHACSCRELRPIHVCTAYQLACT